MIQFPSLSITKSLLMLLFISAFLFLAAPKTLACDGDEHKSEDKINTASSSDSVETKTDTVGKQAPNILYTPLREIRFDTPETVVPVKAQTTVAAGEITNVSLSHLVMNSVPAVPNATSQSTRLLNKIPMTAGEKFNYFFKSSFLSLGAYGNAAFSGLRGETFDKDHDPNNEKGNFFADAGTRAARSFTFGATSKFFERFFWASIFRQDPRYHRSNKTGAGAKIGYAISRVFITEGDKGGNQFNISYLGGGASAAFMSRLYEREERRSLNKVLSKWGNHIAITMFSNIFREFFSGQ